MTNSNDSLHLYNNTSDTVNQRIFQEFKSGDNIISLNDYFDPRDKRKVRISFNGLPSLSKYANELIIDFPYSDNSKIHINFWNYGSDVSADFKGLTLKSIKKVTDGRYQGIHYFLNPYGRYFTNLRYKDGWVHGSSVIFRWKSKTLIGEFEMGRIQSMPMLFYKSDTIIKVSDGKLSKEDISFYIGLIIRKNLPNYLGVHEDCSSCILEYFNGFYGIDLLGLGISPDIWDLEERGIASGNYPLPKKDYTREETKKMLKMRSTIEGKFNK